MESPKGIVTVVSAVHSPSGISRSRSEGTGSPAPRRRAMSVAAGISILSPSSPVVPALSPVQLHSGPIPSEKSVLSSGSSAPISGGGTCSAARTWCSAAVMSSKSAPVPSATRAIGPFPAEGGRSAVTSATGSCCPHSLRAARIRPPLSSISSSCQVSWRYPGGTGAVARTVCRPVPASRTSSCRSRSMRTSTSLRPLAPTTIPALPPSPPARRTAPRTRLSRVSTARETRRPAPAVRTKPPAGSVRCSQPSASCQAERSPSKASARTASVRGPGTGSSGTPSPALPTGQPSIQSRRVRTRCRALSRPTT